VASTEEMRLRVLLLLLLLLVTMMIITNCHCVALEMVPTRRCSSSMNSGLAGCQQPGSVPKSDGPRPVPNGVVDGGDVNDGSAHDEKVVEFRGLRQRRSLRQEKVVELAETSRGQLFTLGTDYAERFSFKDPPPRQLEISAVMGNVLLLDGHRLDYETEPEMEFTVIVTRVDDVACECVSVDFVSSSFYGCSAACV